MRLITKWIASFIFAIFILFALTVCALARIPVQVAVSIPPQAYIVNQIGGGRVNVIVMLPPGANPATFEPKANSLLSLTKADIYFRIHVPFEDAWMKKFKAVNRRMKLIDTTKGIAVVNRDPHIWLSPSLTRLQAKTVCESLMSIDPDGAGSYDRNLKRFYQRTEELTRKIKKRLVNLKRRVILVYHPCWGYFAREFGLTQIAIEQGGKEPGAGALARIMKIARLQGIRCVFAQPQFDTRSALIISRQIHGRLVLIDPLAEDWDRNLLKVAGKIADCLKKGR